MACVDKTVADGIADGIAPDVAQSWRTESIDCLIRAVKSGDYSHCAMVVEGVAGEEGAQLVWDIAGETP
jgi:hypothetical protein